MLRTVAAFDRMGEENAFAVLARATDLARQGRDIVNLGIGQPTLVADHLTAEQGVTLHTENGMLGMGRAAVGDEVDQDLINAGKIPVVETPGAAYFHHADSFAMMRGGHLDVCVLGAFQVSVRGDLANWHTGAPDAIPAVGGAMYLAIGARDVFVMMTPGIKYMRRLRSLLADRSTPRASGATEISLQPSLPSRNRVMLEFLACCHPLFYPLRLPVPSNRRAT